MPDLLRLIRVGEIETLDDIRPAALNEHPRLAINRNDQRLTLVATQSAARLRPDHLQLADVRRVDIFQSAVTGQLRITAWCRPKIWVLCAVGHFVPRDRRTGDRGECHRGTKHPHPTPQYGFHTLFSS